MTLVAACLGGCGASREELAAAHNSTIDAFCVDCHNDVEQVSDLTLESLDVGKVAADRATWESVVRKLRGGMMPPPDGGARPDPVAYVGLTEWLEQELDAAYVPTLPPPGMHRLNRAEYANAVRDLLALDVDATEFLPADDASRGFDNQAGTLNLSSSLLEAYLAAAGRISRLAIGTANAPTQSLYRVAEDATQNYHVEGLPFGTRGGILIEHQFPVDGEYNIKIFAVNLGNMGNFRPFGEVRGEQLEVLLNGERVSLIDWDEAFNVGGGFGGGTGQLQTIDVPVQVTAGPHRVGVTFLASNYAPLLDLNNDFERSTIETGGLPGFTFFPHVGRVRIDGPYNPGGAAQTPSRQAIFVCEPTEQAEEAACARSILSRLARRAYRGLQTEEDIASLLEFFNERGEDGFDGGIQLALQRMLVDPKFLYRFEAEPAYLAPGEIYEISDLELASRLSFFVWSSLPDAELLDLAETGRLSDPAVLEQQVYRMIEDPRSAALTTSFAAQWLGLRSLEVHAPVVNQFPDFDDNLRQAFRRETELLFDSMIRENRSALELLTADYTFLNERLAKHYGIPGIKGSRFRRVELSEEFDARRGLLGKGSVLTVSSQPGRTSPVMRGKWILGNVIGVPAPDPPPDVPPLEAKAPDAAGNTRQPTLREQMEEHRTNPACKGCHMLMDPFGFALETFDATGHWRTADAGTPIDTSIVMFDGTAINGPSELREFVLKYSDQYLRNVAEKLLTYALGRGVEYYDMPVVRSIVREAAADEYRFVSLIMSVVQSMPFRTNMKAPAEPQVARSD